MKLKNVFVGMMKTADKVKVPQVMKDLSSIVTTGVVIRAKKTGNAVVVVIKATKGMRK